MTRFLDEKCRRRDVLPAPRRDVRRCRWRWHCRTSSPANGSGRIWIRSSIPIRMVRPCCTCIAPCEIAKAPGGAEFVPELIHNRSGVGSHLSVADLNNDGSPEIITSTKRGTFIFWNNWKDARRTAMKSMRLFALWPSAIAARRSPVLKRRGPETRLADARARRRRAAIFAAQADQHRQRVESADSPGPTTRRRLCRPSAHAAEGRQKSEGSTCRPHLPRQSGPARRFPTPRQSAATPLVIDGVHVHGHDAYNRVVALDADTGKEIWVKDIGHTPSTRGIAYWPGTRRHSAAARLRNRRRIVAADFAERQDRRVHAGIRQGRQGRSAARRRRKISASFASRCRRRRRSTNIWRSPAITRRRARVSDPRVTCVRGICGPASSCGRFTRFRGRESRTTTRGENDQWVDRAGANAWGFITVDEARGIAYVPVGTPATDFYGGDRLGFESLRVVAVWRWTPTTGKLKWFFQTTHHDNWDYDLTSPPTLIDVKRNGRTIPAVAHVHQAGPAVHLRSRHRRAHFRRRGAAGRFGQSASRVTSTRPRSRSRSSRRRLRG